MIKPKKLEPGQKVALIAPSSALEEKQLQYAIDSINYLGLEPVIYPSCEMRHGYLAGEDTQRLKDLNDAFKSDAIKGIFCIRGGYGATRLLKDIDYRTISKNPKVFIGYSDITAIHIALQNHCNMVTFHGPMPSSGYYRLDQVTMNSLKKNILTNVPVGKVPVLNDHPVHSLCPGTVTAPIVGGNLSLIASTLGSPYELNAKGKILFLEDTDESPYRLDKMLTAMSLAGKFKDCAGIILCTWSNCEEKEHSSEKTLTLEEIFNEVILPFKKPTIGNFRVGHIYPQFTIPIGTTVELNAKNGTVTFLESGTV